MIPWESKSELKKVFEIVDKANEEDRERWKWITSKFKYIELRIDMRDGHFVLFDRDGNRVSVEELEAYDSSTSRTENSNASS